MTNKPQRMARREFLTAIGRTVGGSAVLRTMAAMGITTSLAACGSSSASSGPAQPPAPPAPPPPPGRPLSPRPGDWPANVGAGKTVTILGGGIAGMTAAWEMEKLGYTCTILEATARAGGRNRTIRSGDVAVETDSVQTCTFDNDPDLYFNPGPARIPQHHEFLLGYCREFNIPLETFVNDNRAALLHSETSFGGQPIIARRAIADLRGNIARLLSLAVNQNALDQELSATDKINIINMLRGYGALDGNSNYTGTSRAGFPGQENVGSRQRGALVSPLQLQELLNETFWQNRQDFAQGLDQQPTMLQPIGGMDLIADAFASRVSQNMIFNAIVTEIRKTANGTRVIYEDAVGNAQPLLETDYCICTIPATVLRTIASDISAGHANEINNFSYATAGKAGFQSRRFWEQDHNIYGGISWTTQPITQIWYPNNAFGQPNGIVVGTYIFGGPDGTNFANDAPATRLSNVISQANNVHPNFGTEVSAGLNGISVAWPKVPFQLGAWGQSTPSTLLTADENIFFAGEHLSILQGWQEGAILSAYHAIDLVVARDTP